VIPFKELDADGIKEGSEQSHIGESINYLKSASVQEPNEGYSAIDNRLLLHPDVTHRGTAGTDEIKKVIDSIERVGLDNNGIRFKFEGAADNPIVNPSPAIDWDFQLEISVNEDKVLSPEWVLQGNLQDGFPAYEIYVRDSDGTSGDNLGTKIYQYDPIPLGRTPADLFPIEGDENVSTDIGEVP
jgi:hypothetical protein